MTLLIVKQSKTRIPREFLHKWTEQLVRQLQKRNIKYFSSKGPPCWADLELTLVFMDAKPAQKLNKTYRNKNYATDVLSFAGDGVTGLGELVICPQVISRQAKEHKLSVWQELGYMVIHGVLHLLEYDHEKSARDAQIMFDLQDDLFEYLCQRFEAVNSKSLKEKKRELTWESKPKVLKSKNAFKI